MERFLQTQLNYRPTESNREMLLDYLESHDLPLTADSLFEAFKTLKSDLAQSDKGLDYGSTRVVVFDERNENPNHYRPERQHVELVEQKSVKRITIADVRKMSAEQFAAALRDTDLAPQIEALLGGQ